MKEHHFLAFDIGASSGRAMLGTLNNDSLEIAEIHRFTNKMMHIHGHFFWNIFELFDELKKGLSICIGEMGIQPESIGIDTWGVDYALVTREGHLAGLPFAYRDSRTNGIMDDFFKQLSSEETYRLSGIQLLSFNTLFQLYSSVKSRHTALNIAYKMLFTPDTLGFLFTGLRKNEYTIASTSQLLKAGLAEWEFRLFDAAGIPHSLVNEIVRPGTVLGSILPEICSETGSQAIPYVAVASHDTASAVASVPAVGENWAYISSGTWSLMGIETKSALVTEKARELNFTNEGGVDGTIRFLKNIMGLWLIQECKKVWDKEEQLSWPGIVEMSTKAKPFAYLIDPDDASYMNPENMPAAICDFCSRTGQGVPQTKAEIARCIYDSLALKYKHTLGQIEVATGKMIEKIHIIGGGANNRFLCQLSANTTGLPIVAGPVEATAIGNLLMQARALGYVGSLAEMRRIVAQSFNVLTYLPVRDSIYTQAYNNFVKIIS